MIPVQVGTALYNVPSQPSTMVSSSYTPGAYAPQTFQRSDFTTFSKPTASAYSVNPFQATHAMNHTNTVQPKFGFLPDFGLVSCPAAFAALCCCCCCALPVLLFALPFLIPG